MDCLMLSAVAIVNFILITLLRIHASYSFTLRIMVFFSTNPYAEAGLLSLTPGCSPPLRVRSLRPGIASIVGMLGFFR